MFIESESVSADIVDFHASVKRNKDDLVILNLRLGGYDADSKGLILLLCFIVASQTKCTLLSCYLIIIHAVSFKEAIQSVRMRIFYLLREGICKLVKKFLTHCEIEGCEARMI